MLLYLVLVRRLQEIAALLAPSHFCGEY